MSPLVVRITRDRTHARGEKHIRAFDRQLAYLDSFRTVQTHSFPGFRALGKSCKIEGDSSQSDFSLLNMFTETVMTETVMSVERSEKYLVLVHACMPGPTAILRYGTVVTRAIATKTYTSIHEGTVYLSFGMQPPALFSGLKMLISLC